MIPFDYHSPTRIVFGPNQVDTLGTLAQECGGSRVLLISDPGVIEAGHTERAIQALQKASIEVQVFGDVQENPTTADVAAGQRLAQDYQPDLLIGLGGGSSMDCAKGINFLLPNGGRIED